MHVKMYVCLCRHDNGRNKTFQAIERVSSGTGKGGGGGAGQGALQERGNLNFSNLNILLLFGTVRLYL